MKRRKRRTRRAKGVPHRPRRVRADREPLRIPTRTGLRNVIVPDVRQRSQIGRYWNAVHLYLAVGDASQLTRFKTVRIKARNGDHVPLLTELRDLDRLGSAGVLSFESIYGRAV